MRLPRLLVAEADLAETGAELRGEQYHHAVRVLRLRVGDRVQIFTAAGREWEGALAELQPDRALVRLDRELPPEPAPAFALTLAQAVGKGEKMDLVVEKCSELGVAGLIPVQSEHTVVRADEQGRRSRRERWQRVAARSAEQCGRRRPLQVELFREAGELAGLVAGYDCCLLAWEQERQRGMGAVLRGRSRPARALAVVGPEGGWSPAEVDQMVAGGAIAVGLGPRVLRTETAGIAVAAVLMYEWGDLG